ncbi:MAG: hypothetical protein V1649_02340 [Patescibacteria group bacterium]
MPLFNYPQKNKKIILALGPESAGNFSVYFQGKIFFSENFGDLLDEKKYKNFQKSVLNFLKNKIKPDIILTDLHPLYKTTLWGKELSQKFKTQHIQVQHHIAHIFSVIGDQIIQNSKFQPDTDHPMGGKIQNCIAVACDGTGYGLDGKIWGGEVFKFKVQSSKFKVIERVGHLENQILIGGDLAIEEPARMLIAILSKAKSYKLKAKSCIYRFVKKYYTRNQFELLYNQLQQNFNCLETSSAGRVLDAVSLLLGFCQNKRNYKHEPIDLLEKNSTIPYKIKPKIIIYKLPTTNYQILTTSLFGYLIKNLYRDKKRLAATAQLYIAQGLYQIVKNLQLTTCNKQPVFFAGGIANNKIISAYLESKDVYLNKKIPRGDAGLSFGQIIYFLLTDHVAEY